MALPDVTLRAATPADAPLLAAWDREPHVIRCTSDDPAVDFVRSEAEWSAELRSPTPYFEHLIAEVDAVPIGAMLIIDPALEPTHYWGDIQRDLRAIDIWIGPRQALGQGYGTAMMVEAIDRCFAEPGVQAIVIDPLASNVAAHRFYRRLGFVVTGAQDFGEDACLVHRLERNTWLCGRRRASQEVA